MMDRGKIIFDVSGSDREGLTVSDLLDPFRLAAGKELDDDKLQLRF